MSCLRVLRVSCTLRRIFFQARTYVQDSLKIWAHRGVKPFLNCSGWSRRSIWPFWNCSVARNDDIKISCSTEESADQVSCETTNKIQDDALPNTKTDSWSEKKEHSSTKPVSRESPDSENGSNSNPSKGTAVKFIQRSEISIVLLLSMVGFMQISRS